MSDMIKTDFALEQEAKAIAQAIFDEYKEDNGGEAFDAVSSIHDMIDRVSEDCDNSQHVIYTARAIAICGNCNTDSGEEWLEDCYSNPFDGCRTFAEVCTRLAFATLYTATQTALEAIVEEWEPSSDL